MVYRTSKWVDFPWQTVKYVSHNQMVIGFNGTSWGLMEFHMGIQMNLMGAKGLWG